MDQRKREQRFKDLQPLMKKVSDSYNSWQPSNTHLDTLKQNHQDYDKKHLQNQNLPPDDSAMKTLAVAMGLYIQTTEDEVDKLRSLGTFAGKHRTYLIKEYEDILSARQAVEKWIEEVLVELEPTPAAVSPAIPPSSKSLFIALLKSLQRTLGIGQNVVDTTKNLFDSQQDNQPIPLADKDITALLDAWQKVVATFSSDPIGTTGSPKRSDGKIEAIISFDVVHSELEKLYNQLTTNVKRTSEDSLDSLLSSVY